MLWKIMFSIIASVVLTAVLWRIGNKKAGPLVIYGLTSLSYSIFFLCNDATIVIIAALFGATIASAVYEAFEK